jgi:hypothetical protein
VKRYEEKGTIVRVIVTNYVGLVVNSQVNHQRQLSMALSMLYDSVMVRILELIVIL